MTDWAFLRHVAHTAEIGDPLDGAEIARIRKIADEVQRVQDTEEATPAMEEFLTNQREEEQ